MNRLLCRGSMILALAACSKLPSSQPQLQPTYPAIVATTTAVEQWFEAEFFWRQRAIAFAAVLQTNPDGSQILTATTLTGQELFSLRQRQQHVETLEQRPETTKLPLPYVYRDVVWIAASASAFNAMREADSEFSATATERRWQQHGRVVWQARQQSDGAWLIDNRQARYQLRLQAFTNEWGNDGLNHE